MINPDDTLHIDTPENITFGYDVAGIGSRFLAALADTAILFVSQLLIFGTVLLIVSFATDSGIIKNTVDNLFNGWIIALAGLISFAFLWGYYIFFEIMWNGQSPGKRLVGLRGNPHERHTHYSKRSRYS